MSDTVAILKQLDKRDWWLWWTAVVVMLLLLVALASMVLPTTLHGGTWTLDSALDLHIRLLGFVVLLFSLYAIYQQILIKRLRSQLVSQIETNITLEVQTEVFKTQSIIDPLTGAYNRRMIEDRLKAELVRSERHGYALTVLVFDLNNFKQINDTRGHAAGDAVLKCFSDRLKKAVRGSDIAGRTGGDEFITILSECHTSEAERVLSRLVNLKADLHGEKVPFEFSVGCAEYQTGDSVEQLLERADSALYVDKRTRKGLRTTSPPGPLTVGPA